MSTRRIRNYPLNSQRLYVIGALLCACLFAVQSARADDVTDWNRIMNDTVLAAKTNPLFTARVAAIVESSVFDSVNGIERKYTSIHETNSAPRGACKRAAAIEAAYEALVTLYPLQKEALDASREASLAALQSRHHDDDDNDDDRGTDSVMLGIQWGHKVADDILAWRSTDGFSPPLPPFLGSTEIGKWRPTPPDFSPGAAPQFATMTPWVLRSVDQFRPSGPPDLTSDAWAKVFNEVKLMGSATNSPRTADQTQLAVFWNGNTPLFWNRIARMVSLSRHLRMSRNALLFGMLNVTMADAGIACWDAKYHFQFWRPITAITFADQDGNAATDVDLTWTPLLPITPAHPEYVSGHSTVSGSAAAVLARFFGDKAKFSVDSEVLPGVLRYFTSFSGALAEIHNARVFGGIHFRNSCVEGSALGESVANYVRQTAFLRKPRHHPR